MAYVLGTDSKADSQKPQLWDEIAKHYSEEPDEGEDEIASELESILASLDIRPGSTLLEAGSGGGHISMHLASSGYKTTLLDFSKVALEKSQKLFKQNGLTGNFVHSDLFEISPDKVGRHDVVWNSGVLEHFDGWQVMDAMRRMASAAERFVIILVPNPKSQSYMDFRRKALEEGSWQWGLEILREEMGDLAILSGLEVVEERFVGQSHLEYFEGFSNAQKNSKTNDVADESKYLKVLVAKPVVAPDRGSEPKLLLEAFQKELEVLRRTYYNDADAMAGGIISLKDLAARLRADLGSERHRASGLEHSINVLEQSNTALKKSNSGLERSITDLNQSITVLKKSNSGLERSITDLNQSITVLKKSNSDLHQQNSNLDQHNSDLTRMLENQKKKNSDLYEYNHSLLNSLDYERQRMDALLDTKTWKLTKLYEKKFQGRLAGRILEGAVDLILRNKQEESGQPGPAPPGPTAAREEQAGPTKEEQASPKEDELGLILEKHQDIKGMVIYPPGIDWNIPLLQRPQHMAMSLAAEGWLYFYCTTNSYDRVKGYKRLSENLYLTDRFDDLTERLDSFFLFVHSAHPTLTIPELREFGRKADLIYDYLDEIHPDVSGLKPRDVLERHHYMMKNSKAVVATASELLADVSQMRKKGAYLIPNAVDYEHFHVRRDPQTMPHEMRPIVESGAPVLGYFGAVAKWIDYSLVKEVAKAHPEWKIVLIGWDYDNSIGRSGMDGYKNIHYLGVKEYSVLPQYAVWFDVCILPFLLSSVTHSTSPIKLFEYMALGKPIVATPLKEVKNYQSPLVAADPGEFEEKIREALLLKDDKKYLELLDSEARDNTWKKRFAELDGIMQSIRGHGKKR